jgi:hypothetical protein
LFVWVFDSTFTTILEKLFFKSCLERKKKFESISKEKKMEQIVTNKFALLSNWINTFSKLAAIDIFSNYESIKNRNEEQLKQIQFIFLKNKERNEHLRAINRGQLDSEFRRFLGVTEQCVKKGEQSVNETRDFSTRLENVKKAAVICRDDFSAFRQGKNPKPVAKSTAFVGGSIEENEAQLATIFNRLYFAKERNNKLNHENQEIKKMIQEIKRGDELCRQTFPANNLKLKNIIFPQLDKTKAEVKQCRDSLSLFQEQMKTLPELIAEAERLMTVSQVEKAIKSAHKKIFERKDEEKTKKFIRSLAMDIHPDKCMARRTKNVEAFLADSPELQVLVDFLKETKLDEKTRRESCGEISATLLKLPKI